MDIRESLGTVSADDIAFDTFLSNGGRNGKVFLVRVRGVSAKIVCKISRIIDYSVAHEYAVMERLMTLRCPNFPVPYTMLSARVDCNYRRKLNPFDISSDMYPINADILLMEFVDGISLENFSKTNSIQKTVALAKQVMLAICVAQEKLGFTHYDLHPGNVIVRETDATELTYTIAGKSHTVKTHGFVAVIIDYGLSYIDGLQHQMCALFFTDVGVYSNRCRPIYDIRRLLVGLQNDTNNTKLEKFTRKMFGKCSIDWEYGWDLLDADSAINHIAYKCYDRKRAKSRVFSEYGPVCIALIQSLIQHPMTGVRGIHGSYTVLETEFSKIENVIGSSFYNIYILKTMVDSARRLVSMYVSDTNRESAVQAFRRETVSVIDTISKFAQVRDINWERLMCSLYAFAAYMDGEMTTYMAVSETKDKPRCNNDIGLYTEFSKIL